MRCRDLAQALLPVPPAAAASGTWASGKGHIAAQYPAEGPSAAAAAASCSPWRSRGIRRAPNYLQPRQRRHRERRKPAEGHQPENRGVNRGWGSDEHLDLRRAGVAPTGLERRIWAFWFPHGCAVGYMMAPAPRAFRCAPRCPTEHRGHANLWGTLVRSSGYTERLY